MQQGVDSDHESRLLKNQLGAPRQGTVFRNWTSLVGQAASTYRCDGKKFCTGSPAPTLVGVFQQPASLTASQTGLRTHRRRAAWTSLQPLDEADDQEAAQGSDGVLDVSLRSDGGPISGADQRELKAP